MYDSYVPLPVSSHFVQFTALEARCKSLKLAITETLNGLLDHRLFSIDRGQLHILLQLSKE